jgi:uncharacterized membrane-anchored protein YhcB (DUF1043 family)
VIGKSNTFKVKRELEDVHEEEQKPKRGRPSKAPKVDSDKDTINQLKTEKTNLDDYCEEIFRIACNMIMLADTMVEDVKELVTSIADPTSSQQKIIRGMYKNRYHLKIRDAAKFLRK